MRYLFTALLLLFIFAACNKTPTSTQSVENTLRTGRWKVTGGTVMVRLPNGKKDTTLQYLNWIPACHKDDYIVFDSLNNGNAYSGTIKCDLSDPDHVPFKWQLRDNNTTIDLFNGYNNIFALRDTILPYNVDTIPNGTLGLKLDTLYGVYDTTNGYTRSLIVLDSFWTLQFDSLKVASFDITGATILNLTKSSFTLNFNYITYYLDTNNFHKGYPDLQPIQKPDTFHYSVNYSNF